MPAERMVRAVAVETGLSPAADPATDTTTETATLDYEGRMIRRRRIVTDAGRDVMVDLAETRSLDEGDRLVLDDGGRVVIVAADEACLAVTGDLPRLAWHIGNRHAPCRIEADRLVIRADPVLARMIAGLGGTATPVTEPFRPEGGAFGHGRTMGHDHGEAHASAHGHAHAHGTSHSHSTSHSHTTTHVATHTHPHGHD